jgi:hypothetical protein
MVAKSSAARGRVTFPPQNLTEPSLGSYEFLAGWARVRLSSLAHRGAPAQAKIKRSIRGVRDIATRATGIVVKVITKLSGSHGIDKAYGETYGGRDNPSQRFDDSF